MGKWGDAGVEYVGWNGGEIVPMIKYPDRNSLEENGFIFAHKPGCS